MGANCCGQQQKLGGGFDFQTNNWQSVEMVPWKDQASQQNLLKNPSAAPAANLGKKSKELPKLYYLVEDSRRRELQSKSLIEPSKRGTVLPPYYINRYKAYYQGQWSNGQPSGLGKLYFENGSYFEGPFVNGQIIGQDGLYFYPDGSFKRGTILNGKLEGQGKFVSRSGNFVYEGNWKNDQPNGKGLQIYPDGSRYQGQFQNGIKNDNNATYKWANGKVYQGPFKNGYMQGYGRLTMNNGKGEYVGEFARNLKVGHGKMKTETGEYQGPFEKGEMHGTGVFKWYDKKVYQGQFEHGELHGNGTMYYPNGQMVEGVWHRGQNLQLNTVGVGKSTVQV